MAAYGPVTSITGFIMIFDLTELDIRQAFSDLYKTRSAFYLSFG